MAALFCLVEGDVFSLGVEVEASVFNRGVGDAHLGGYSLALVGGELQIKACANARCFVWSGAECVVVESYALGGLAVDCRREIDGHGGIGLISLYVFGICNHPAFNGGVVHQFNRSVLHGAAFAHAAANVKQHGACFALGECESLQRHAFGGSHFGADAVVFQHHRVVAGGSHFVVVAISRAIAFFRNGVGGQSRGGENAVAVHCHERDSAHLKLVYARKAFN